MKNKSSLSLETQEIKEGIGEKTNTPKKQFKGDYMIRIISRTAALEQMIRESGKQFIPASSRYAKLMCLSAVETSGFLDKALLDFNIFTEDGRLIRKLQQIDFEELINPVSSLMEDLKKYIAANHLVWNDVVEVEGNIVIKNKVTGNREIRSEIVQFIPVMDSEFLVNNRDCNVKEAENGNK